MRGCGGSGWGGCPGLCAYGVLVLLGAPPLAFGFWGIELWGLYVSAFCDFDLDPHTKKLWGWRGSLLPLALCELVGSLPSCRVPLCIPNGTAPVMCQA